MEHIRYIKKPSLTMYPGICVKSDTVLAFRSKTTEQTLENLVFHSVTRLKGENYDSTYDTTIYLKEGDILIYEDEEQGYFKPAERLVTIKEAAEELECIKDLG